METKRVTPPRRQEPSFWAGESGFLAAAVEDGIRIQSRFRPEPLLNRTPRGYVASSGVAEIARAKAKSVGRK